MIGPRVIEQLCVNTIEVPPVRRDIQPDTVKLVAESIAKIGLRTPISVRRKNETTTVLVAGAHRLEAVKQLGWEKIDCFVIDGGDVEAELWEIAENLHRAELAVLERGEQVARWVQLTDKVSAQLAPKPQQGGRPEGGERRAARDLGLDRTAVQRAVKIASLTPDAKQAAREAGLDDNQSVLLAAAKAEPARQAEVIRKRLAARLPATAASKCIPKPAPEPSSAERQYETLKQLWRMSNVLNAAWARSNAKAQRRFLQWLDDGDAVEDGHEEREVA